MSIPASLAISKLRWPETEESLTAGHVTIPPNNEERPTNSLHAFGNGSWLGLKIGAMIIAALLCILSLLGLTNGLLTWWGHYLNIRDPDLTVQLILGYLFYPVAFLLGVDREGGDLLKVSQLIGIKVVANEFIAVSPFWSSSFSSFLLPFLYSFPFSVIHPLPHLPPPSSNLPIPLFHAPTNNSPASSKT